MVFVLAPGRWDNWLASIDLDRALASDGTDAAILSRPRATPDLDATGNGLADTPASGQPVSLAVLGRHAFVVNHSGLATPAEAQAFQHGHQGTLSVLDLDAALDPATSGTTRAIEAIIPLGLAGPVGIATTPDHRHLLVASAEARGMEDGGRSIVVVDAQTRRVVSRCTLKLRGPNLPEATGEPLPEPLPAPHPGYGRYPCPNGIAVSPLGYVVTGNGGSEDISILALDRVLGGRDDAELCRLPLSSGGFGASVSPDGRLAAVAARESMRVRAEGNRIHLFDLEGRRELASLLVGTDDPTEPTRPFMAAFTPDGRHLLASGFRTDTVTLFDVADAASGGTGLPRHLRLATPSGGPGAPRGIAITPDGRHAAVSGGRKSGPGSSVLFVLEIDPLRLAATVTGIGNETYLLGLLDRGGGSPA